MQLPSAYEERMRRLLGAEYDAYAASLEEPRVKSLRINTAKCSVEEAAAFLPPGTEPVPWVREGRYYPDDFRASRQPAYFAGLYYLQEASAMTPGAVLPVSPGDRVLDLCAAPGGKSTQLAARMQGGVLVSNDISASRAQALLHNLELAGAASVFVTAEDPAVLVERMAGSFDAVLVDAPCSGEGMFRRDSSVEKDWLCRGPAYYQPVQAVLLDQAAALTAPGGFLLYSTCTFSEEENEQNIAAFCRRYPDFSLEAIPLREGFSEGFLPGTVRIWPHRARGEGHFLALLHREGEKRQRERIPAEKNRTPKLPPAAAGFRERLPESFRSGPVLRRDEVIYQLPEGERILPGVRYLRTGLKLGEMKKERFVPSQALAMALEGKDFPDTVSFAFSDERAVRYLKGETVDAEGADIRGGEGTVLVCLDRYPLGWAVRSGTRLKNKLQTSWRWQ